MYIHVFEHSISGHIHILVCNKGGNQSLQQIQCPNNESQAAILITISPGASAAKSVRSEVTTMACTLLARRHRKEKHRLIVTIARAEKSKAYGKAQCEYEGCGDMDCPRCSILDSSFCLSPIDYH